MNENSAYIITCTISKHDHACCFACFDSNGSIIFPLLWNGNGIFLNPWGLVLQSLHRKYSTTSHSINGEKRANWNWLGWPTIEIRARLFEQQAIFRVDFLSRGKCRKFLNTRGLGNPYFWFIELSLLTYSRDFNVASINAPFAFKIDPF
jgi:hypothetical protein